MLRKSYIFLFIHSNLLDCFASFIYANKRKTFNTFFDYTSLQETFKYDNLHHSFIFRYTIGMFKKGYRKTLDVDDLYNPIKSDRSTTLGDRLERLVFLFILTSFIFFILCGCLNMLTDKIYCSNISGYFTRCLYTMR